MEKIVAGANGNMDIEALIPHRDRMKLIDCIVEISERGAITTARVSDRWPLHADGGVDPLVLIELVAQTAAVHISGTRPKGSGEVDRRGWMVGIKSAEFFAGRIPLGTVLKTVVNSLYKIEQYSVLEGEVYAGADLMGRIEVQVLRESENKTGVAP